MENRLNFEPIHEPILSEPGLTEDAAPGFAALLIDELGKLEPFNCARYRIAMSGTEAWIAAGRPR